MTSHESSLGLRFRPVLAQREAQLRELLRASLVASSEPASGQEGVNDFKDMAAEQSMELVDEVQSDRAAVELKQVLAALQRIEEGSYGQCLDCEEPIDERRLRALPAAAFCTACQALHEHARPR